MYMLNTLIRHKSHSCMRVNVKITSPTDFYFDNLASSEINGTLSTVVELEKKLPGYLEKAIVLQLDTEVWISGTSGSSLLLQCDSEHATIRLLQGKSNWANVYLIPHAFVPTRQGIYEDANLVFIGRAMVVPLSSSIVDS